MAYPLFHERGPSITPMVMTAADFQRAFPGEGTYVEFKQGLPEHKIREAITAFSNTDGGVLLLGVRDDGVVSGLDVTGETEARVHRTVLGVRDPGRYEVRRVPVDDRLILAISIQRRREGFAQMNDGRILVRRGAMNTPLFGQELATFVAGRSLTRYEHTATTVPLSAIDASLLDHMSAVCGWSSDPLSRAYELGLMSGVTPESVLTVAGVLYLTPRPSDVLGKAYIEIFRYRVGSTTYDKRLEITGPIDRQVEEAVQQLMGELGSDVVVLGVHRHELPRIPEPVLREALANAVAHRTYELAGQPVRVDVWPDRVVIRSPGGLPEPVTVANIREQNAPRNVQVIKILRRYRLAEDAGMGVDVMEDAMEAALLEKPRFESDGTYVSVVLPLDSTVTPQERAWVAEVEQRGEIHANERLILLHAARGRVLTNASVRDLLNIDSVHARSALGRLRDLGYLTQHGTRGGASYSLARELGPPPGLQLDSDALREVVLTMAIDAGRVTNESVRKRTGLDRAQVLSLLTSLVERGQLQRRGERRGSYYTPVRPTA